MAEELQIEKFTGVYTNKVEGVGQAMPSYVSALEISKAGGYTFFSEDDGGTTATGVVGFDVLAHDDEGYNLLLDASANAKFWKHGVISGSQQFNAVLTNPGPADPPYIENVGAYYFYDYWLIRNRDGDAYGSTTYGEPYTAAPTVTSSAGSGNLAESSSYTLYFMHVVKTLAGKFVTQVVSRVASTGAGHDTLTVNPFENLAVSFNDDHVEVYIQEGSSYFGFGPNEPIKYYDSVTSAGNIDIEYVPEGSRTAPDEDFFVSMALWDGTTATMHQNRVYGQAGFSFGDFRGTSRANLPAEIIALSDYYEYYIVYSELGWVNLMSTANYFPDPTRGNVTALVSTPAGLLICEPNGMHLMRGDPSSANSTIQRVTSALGHDNGAGQPARIGGVVFVISEGEVHQISFGMGDVDFGQGIKHISQPIDDKDDPIVEVMADLPRRHIVARTAKYLWRYDLDAEQWYDDPRSRRVNDDTFDNAVLLMGTDSVGVRVLQDPGDGTRDQVHELATVTGQSGYLRYDDLDMGQPGFWKALHSIELYTNEEYGAGDPLIIGDIDLYYRLDGDTWLGPVNSNVIELRTATGNKGGKWLFRFPNGRLFRKMDFRLEFLESINYEVRPPITIHYTLRHRERY